MNRRVAVAAFALTPVAVLTPVAAIGTAHAHTATEFVEAEAQRLLADGAGGVRADQVEERAALEAVERTGRESLAEMHRMLGVLRSGGHHAPVQPLPRLDQLSERVNNYRDAIRFNGGHATLLQNLPVGMRMTVVSPAPSDMERIGSMSS